MRADLSIYFLKYLSFESLDTLLRLFAMRWEIYFGEIYSSCQMYLHQITDHSQALENQATV